MGLRPGLPVGRACVSLSHFLSVCVSPLTVNKHSKAANIKKKLRRQRRRKRMLRKRFINVHKDCEWEAGGEGGKSGLKMKNK